MMNIQEALFRVQFPASRAQPGRKDLPAIITVSGEKQRIVSFADLERLINRAQAAFMNHGAKAGSTVMICSPNTPEMVAALLATWRIGAIAIPIDFRLTRAEVENVASAVSANIVYTPHQISANFDVVNEDSWPQEWQEASMTECPKPDGPSLVILTSGTTGTPKGAVHDLQSLIGNLIELGEKVDLGSGQTSLLPIPLSHVFGLEVMLAHLIYGGCTAFAEFSPTQFPDYLERVKPTMLVGVPTIYGALLQLPASHTSITGINMLLSGGAPLPLSLAQEYQRKFNKRITQGYGTTEAKIVLINLEGPVNATGTPIPSSKIDIVDENDQVLGPGQSGELRISGPSLMLGYLNQPETTAAVLHNGHYHTGDIGYIEEGRVYISGRLKDMIIVAGNKIFPSEVESVIRQHPMVEEVAVIGVPHRRLGQIVKAVIVAKPGPLSDRLNADAAKSKEASSEMVAGLRDFCKQHLKRELRPMDWDIRPSCQPLPKTHTGKIDKKQLEPVPA